MNEWKRLLAEIKNIKLNSNNNIKQYIYHRCYQVKKNINPKSLNISFINLAYRYKPIETTRLQHIFKLERDKAFTALPGRSFHASIRLQANENWRALLWHIGLTSL